MKKCTRCQVHKPLTEYNRNESKKDKLQTRCRDCSRQNSKSYYRENSSRMIVQIAEAQDRRIEENTAKLIGYLLANPCRDCGEKDPIVLDFDHNGSDKVANVSHMIVSGLSWKTIEKEMQKCQVLCANCHRRKTAREQKHTRYGLVMSMASIVVSYTVREGSTPSKPTGTE